MKSSTICIMISLYRFCIQLFCNSVNDRKFIFGKKIWTVNHFTLLCFSSDCCFFSSLYTVSYRVLIRMVSQCWWLEGSILTHMRFLLRTVLSLIHTWKEGEEIYYYFVFLFLLTVILQFFLIRFCNGNSFGLYLIICGFININFWSFL